MGNKITASEMGKKGGKSRMKKLSKEERQALGRKGAQARWNGKGRKTDK